MKRLMAVLPVLLMLFPAVTRSAAENPLPIADAHMHYSHDAWDMLPPDKAADVLRRAGLALAMVSSSSDDGTQMLYEAAPDIVVPVLRPYRRRGETGTWFRDPAIIDHLAERLERNRYAGIGEFHIYGTDADSPVMRRVVDLARQYGIFLHSHSDADAIHRQFAQWPGATILWAHSGFDSPADVRVMLERYPRLYADLAFRSDHARDGKVDADWRQLFLDYPGRFMVGSDTFTPERWYYVIDHADWSREWLSDLPQDVAERIAWRNARGLADWALGQN